MSKEIDCIGGQNYFLKLQENWRLQDTNCTKVLLSPWRGVRVRVSLGMGITLESFRTKLFYMMSKALSGELSCMQTGFVKLSCTQTDLVLSSPLNK